MSDVKIEIECPACGGKTNRLYRVNFTHALNLACRECLLTALFSLTPHLYEDQRIKEIRARIDQILVGNFEIYEGR